MAYNFAIAVFTSVLFLQTTVSSCGYGNNQIGVGPYIANVGGYDIGGGNIGVYGIERTNVGSYGACNIGGCGSGNIGAYGNGAANVGGYGNGAANVGAYGNGAANVGGYGNGAANIGYYGIGNSDNLGSNIDLGSYSRVFNVVSSSPAYGYPSGITISSENEISGQVSAFGAVPFIGSACVDGNLPTVGDTSVRYEAGPAALIGGGCGYDISGSSGYSGSSWTASAGNCGCNRY